MTKNNGMAKHKNNFFSEPIVRLVKRDNASFIYKLLVRVFAVGLSLLAILIFARGVTGGSFAQLWDYMKFGAFGNEFNINDLFKEMMVLLCISLALAPAFKMKFWNIGAQGQVLMGALLTSVVMYYMSDALGNAGTILIMFVFAVLAGGIWALIPAFFKVKLNANETLFTLMMNYIAIQLVACCMDIWKGRNSALAPFNTDTHFGYLPELFGNEYGLTFLLVAVLTVLIFIYMRKTKHGYELSVVGESLNTARYAGINTKKVIMRTMFLSGAICGFCGFLYVGGINHGISTITGGSYGFTAIIVAWSASFNPFAMALISFAIVFLERGSGGIINNYPNLNGYTAYIIVGIFLFLLIGCEFFINYKIVFSSKFAALNDKLKDGVVRLIAKMKPERKNSAAVNALENKEEGKKND